ncbi:hypothetical protein pb186bvf_013883 [Paramecium bursaria]
MFILFIQLALCIQEKAINFEASNSKREIILLYQKNIDQAINLALNAEQQPLHNTISPLYERIDLTLWPAQTYKLSLLAAKDSYFVGVTVFAAWIYSGLDSKFFYFEKEWNYVSQDEYDRPQFHFSAPRNWINDPNGFIRHKNLCHIFYQYNPISLAWGNMFWGHAVSSDCIKWKHLPIALEPGQKIVNASTVGGAFSGGAIIHKGNIMIFYTDSLETQYDFIEIQNYSISSDYVKFENRTSVISTRPNGASKDFRDPTIYQNGQYYYMVLGTAMDGIPAVIQYRALDPVGPWTYNGVFYKFQLNATTIECPNVVIYQKNTSAAILIFSIIDLSLQSSLTLYVLGNIIKEQFVATTQPLRIDYGGHYYAAQTTEDIIIGWMQDWKKDKKYFGNDKFSSVFTLPRKLTVINQKLYQNVISEGQSLIGSGRLITESIVKLHDLSYLLFTYNNLQDFNIVLGYDEQLIIYLKLQQNLFGLIVKEGAILQQCDAQLSDIGFFNSFTLEIWVDRAALEVYIHCIKRKSNNDIYQRGINRSIFGLDKGNL